MVVIEEAKPFIDPPKLGGSTDLFNHWFGGTMKRVLITLFSVGWLAPTWLAANTYLGFWRGDGWTLLWGRKDVGSFPVIQFSQQCLAVGVIWLAAVLAFWSWRLSGSGGPKQ